MATGEGLKEKCEDNNNNNTEKKIEKVLNKVKGPAPAIDSGCKAIIPSVVQEEVSPGTQTVKNFYLHVLAQKPHGGYPSGLPFFDL